MGRQTSRHLDQRRRREEFLKDQLAARQGSSWNWVLIVGGLGFLTVLLYVSASVPTPFADASDVQPAELLQTGQDVRLAAVSFADGRARFYRYTTEGGREIRFFILRSEDGILRAAFDACDLCYPRRRGFQQSGQRMVCNTCGRAFRSLDVGAIAGGCNPGRLEYTIAGDQVVITTEAIERGGTYF